MPEASRDVSLTVPARPGYLVLARLALSAVCRLTALEPVEVADLKLAVTEAANGFVTDRDDGTDATIAFDFRLDDTRLTCEMRGSGAGARGPDEEELSRAIIEATVDTTEFSPGRAVLVKAL